MQEPGKFNLTLVVMPSCWLGCNATAAVSFNALKQTAAEKAGKGPARGKDKNAPKFLDADEVCCPYCCCFHCLSVCCLTLAPACALLQYSCLWDTV